MEGWLGDLDVGADNPETDGAAEGTDEEKVATADSVDQPKEPDEGYDGLDNAEDTSSEETCVGTGDTDGLWILLAFCHWKLCEIKLTLNTVGE